MGLELVMTFSSHLFSNSEVYQNDERARGNSTLVFFDAFSLHGM